MSANNTKGFHKHQTNKITVAKAKGGISKKSSSSSSSSSSKRKSSASFGSDISKKSSSSSSSSKKKSSASFGSDVAQPAAPVSHGSLDLKDDFDENEELLRQFDLNMAYGPCIGMTRLARWERANSFGMNPPSNIRDLLKSGKVQSDCLWDGGA